MIYLIFYIYFKIYIVFYIYIYIYIFILLIFNILLKQVFLLSIYLYLTNAPIIDFFYNYI
ncbi:hypothetical protein DWX74_02080 [Peptoclostridium sp. AF21-18]|nr:hypothetical protein DWX74_02080 [Peptoclostridium sp. AF21-18]